MPKKLKLKEIINRNPKVKKDELKRYSLLTKKLHEAGFIPVGYQLLSPEDRRLNKACEEKLEDPRTVYLSSAKD